MSIHFCSLHLPLILHLHYTPFIVYKIAKMAPIERITLFKIPNDEDVNRVLEQYKVLVKTAVKVP